MKSQSKSNCLTSLPWISTYSIGGIVTIVAMLFDFDRLFFVGLTLMLIAAMMASTLMVCTTIINNRFTQN